MTRTQARVDSRPRSRPEKKYFIQNNISKNFMILGIPCTVEIWKLAKIYCSFFLPVYHTFKIRQINSLVSQVSQVKFTLWQFFDSSILTLKIRCHPSWNGVWDTLEDVEIWLQNYFTLSSNFFFDSTFFHFLHVYALMFTKR